jgi:hypothetical protein
VWLNTPQEIQLLFNQLVGLISPFAALDAVYFSCDDKSRRAEKRETARVIDGIKTNHLMLNGPIDYSHGVIVLVTHLKTYTTYTRRMLRVAELSHSLPCPTCPGENRTLVRMNCTKALPKCYQNVLDMYN